MDMEGYAVEEGEVTPAQGKNKNVYILAAEIMSSRDCLEFALLFSVSVSRL